MSQVRTAQITIRKGVFWYTELDHKLFVGTNRRALIRRVTKYLKKKAYREVEHQIVTKIKV